MLVVLAASPQASASLTSCATPWSNFTGPNGFVRQYTYLGAEIRDYEASGAGGDPTNGGSAVNPASIDISSGSPGSPPGPDSSVAFGYYDGGTRWNPTDPMTLEDIGTLLGITRERVRQIKEKALLKLRSPYRSSKLREFADFVSKN